MQDLECERPSPLYRAATAQKPCEDVPVRAIPPPSNRNDRSPLPPAAATPEPPFKVERLRRGSQLNRLGRFRRPPVPRRRGRGRSDRSEDVPSATRNRRFSSRLAARRSVSLASSANSTAHIRNCSISSGWTAVSDRARHRLAYLRKY